MSFVVLLCLSHVHVYMALIDLYIHFITIKGNMCIYLWSIPRLVGRDTCRIKTMVLFRSVSVTFILLHQFYLRLKTFMLHKMFDFIIMTKLRPEYQHNIRLIHVLKRNTQTNDIKCLNNRICKNGLWQRADQWGCGEGGDYFVKGYASLNACSRRRK